MRLFLIGLAASLVASPAAAQSTRCYRIGIFTQCDQVPQVQPYSPPAYQAPNLPPPNAAMDGFMRAREAMQADRMRKQQEPYAISPPLPPPPPAYMPPPQAQFVAPQETRKQIGELLKAGKCPDGVNLALEAGDIELASRVGDFCKQNGIGQ